MKILFCFLALAPFVVLGQYCGVNEVYSTCGYCDKTCDGPIACTAACREGCFCAEGYVRQLGICIPAQSCPGNNPNPNPGQYCGVNEVYSTCGYCDKTCDGPIACSAACREGCFCADGYVRQGGICIPPQSCPSNSPNPNPGQYCGVNEVYSTCGYCDKICDGPIACSAACREGCFCADGYVRQLGICIPAQSCPGNNPNPNPNPNPAPVYCNINEIYIECGGCDQFCGEGPIACGAACRPGCYCANGNVRSFQGGICIPADKCPRAYDYGNPPMVENSGPAYDYYENPPMVENSGAILCNGPNEEFQKCGVGKQCEDYCGRGANACAYCQNGCYCQKGFVRSGPEANAQCIPEQQCPRAYGNGNAGSSYDAYDGYDGYYDPAPVVENSGPGYDDYYGPAPIIETDPVPDYNPPPMVENSGAILCNRPNEEFQKCGVGKQCENYCGRGPNACAYCQDGCYCQKGYVRSGPEADAKCIREKDCPRAYGNGGASSSNDEYDGYDDYDGYYDPAPVVENSGSGYDDYYGPAPLIETDPVPDYYNPPPMMENSGSGYDDYYGPPPVIETDPVPDYNPPPMAQNSGAILCNRPNEEFQKCGVGKQCEDYCGRGANACAYCQDGCYCKKGYVREGPEADAKCIRKNKCPRAYDDSGPAFGPGPVVLASDPGGPPQGPGDAAPKCGKNEEYQSCGTRCPANCDDRKPNCSEECVEGCFCKKNYIRKYSDAQRKGNECVKSWQCPKS